jgi:hypothetical protein
LPILTIGIANVVPADDLITVPVICVWSRYARSRKKRSACCRAQC